MIYHWFIYKITNPIGQIYVGKTRNIGNRIRQYKHGSHPNQPIIYSSIKKYGFENHIIDIIDEFENNSKYAEDKEMFWIRTMMCNKHRWPEMNGMNQTDGGVGGLGCPASDKQKLTAKYVHKGKKYCLGRKTPEETKQKIREKNTGLKRTAQQILNIKASNLKSRGRPIIQVDVNGNVIEEYAAIMVAADKLGIDYHLISLVLRGKQKSTKGMYFKYK